MKAAVSIDSDLFDHITEWARKSPRLRINFNFHELDDPANRMLNAIEQESYIRSHRHLEPPLDEAFLVLPGLGAVLLFNDHGLVERILPLCVKTCQLGADIPAGWYHTIVSLETGSVFYEVKAGPYDPKRLKDFPPWAPPEGSSEARNFLASLKKLAGNIY